MAANASLILRICVLYAAVLLATGQYSVNVIGNRLQPSGQGVDSPGVVLLLETPFPSDGVVFAIEAYFRTLDPTAFQIWRPAPSNSSSSSSSLAFTLVAELNITPSANTELIYVTSRFMKCIRIQNGDRFGIYSYAKPSSIGYVFNPSTFQAVTFPAANESFVHVGMTAAFKAITFPYDLSCQVFYYLESQNSDSSNETTVDCPPNLYINSSLAIKTSPNPIPSGVSGVIGQKGPVGYQGFDGPTGPRGEQGGTGPQGPLGAPGPKGPLGPTGPTGSSGPKGVVGDSGDTGPVGSGQPGATGPAGRPGSPGQLIHVNGSQPLELVSDPATSSDSSDWSNKWTSEMFMIGLLIWLAILSTIILILLLSLIIVSCVICSIHRHDDRISAKIKAFHHHENDPYKNIRKTVAAETELNSDDPSFGDSADGTMPKSTDAPTLEQWMGEMKEDSVDEYNLWYGVQ